MGLLRAGDRELTGRQIYDHTDAESPTSDAMPFEVRRLGRTITRWAAQIVTWHRSNVTNGPPNP